MERLTDNPFVLPRVCGALFGCIAAEFVILAVKQEWWDVLTMMPPSLLIAVLWFWGRE